MKTLEIFVETQEEYDAAIKKIREGGFRGIIHLAAGMYNMGTIPRNAVLIGEGRERTIGYLEGGSKKYEKR